MLLPSSLFDAADDRVRLTFGHERIPRLLERWASHTASAHPWFDAVPCSRSIIDRNLAACRAHVEAHPTLLEWCEPAGGTFAFVRLRVPGVPQSNVSAHAYCEQLRRRARAHRS